MNLETPDLKTIGAEALRDLLNNLTQAKGFILDQAPDFCQQLVMRGMVMPFVGCAVAILGAAVCFRLGAWCSRDGCRILKEGGPEYRADMEMTRSFQFCMLITAGVVGIVIGLIAGFQALSVYVAPKVFLVEEITRMLK